MIKKEISLWNYVSTSITTIVIFISFLTIVIILFDRISYPNLFAQVTWFIFISIASLRIGTLILLGGLK